MDPSANASPARQAAPVVLIAALIQGGALYGLHRVAHAPWAATHPAWLLALYSVAGLIPTTVQLLADQVRRSVTWVLITILAALLFYFGWHHGAAVVAPNWQHLGDSADEIGFAFVTLVWWLLVMPFVQCRLSGGRWTVDYPQLFRTAWRDHILLAEAALFTGLFWLILFLWQTLFSMLGIDFFGDLFAKPGFAYPVTALVFGCALHLIGSIDQLFSVALDQVLNVLKWLATVACALLTLFTIALLLKLPGLLFAGERAISAIWLLWLNAVVVLLWNAAYRDGTAQPSYPGWVAQALRFCLPLAIVVAFTALYALIVRVQSHGLTVLRVCAFFVAGPAAMYSVGYAVAAVRKGPWLAGIARVNVAVALTLIVALAAGLTPLLSPYRLAADSQMGLILQGRYPSPSVTQYAAYQGPFTYLAFSTGEYGRRRLQQLSSLHDHPHADEIRSRAARVLQQQNPWEAPPDLEAPQRVARLAVYPAGHALDPDLARKLAADWSLPSANLLGFPSSSETAAGVFADLDGDGIDEFVLLSQSGGPAYQKRSGHWQYIGQVHPQRAAGPWAALQAALGKGKLSVVAPAWKELAVGDQRFRVDAAEPAPTPTASPLVIEQPQ